MTVRNRSNGVTNIIELWRLRRDTVLPHIGVVNSNLDRFTFRNKNDLLYASFETLLENGLDNLFSLGLAKIIHDNEESVICVFPPQASESKYKISLFYLPHRDSVISHTLDQIPAEDRVLIVSALRNAVTAILNTAERNGESLRKLYIFQHIGPSETETQFETPGAVTTTLAFHLHIYGISERQLISPQDKGLLRVEGTFSFWDPTVFIVYDIMKGEFPNISMDTATSSIIVSRIKLEEGEEISRAVKDVDLDMVASLIGSWKSNWYGVLRCFTDFSIDANARYIPFPNGVRNANVANFIQEHPTLSDESRIVLNYLAVNLKDAAGPGTRQERHNFYKGISGSFGYTIDIFNREAALRFAPRTLISEKYGSTDGEFVAIKDKEHPLSRGDIEAMVAVQRDIISRI